MYDTIENLKTFISCPGDVKKEKELLIKHISELNKSIKDITGLNMDPFDWEDFIPITPRLPDETIQDKLNENIPKCKFFILILFKRYGSIEPGHKLSNTEREVNVALNLLKKEGKIAFLAYFKKFVPRNDKGPQEKGVLKFKQSLVDQGVLFKEFTNEDDFKEKVIHDLYRTILNYRFSKKKTNALRKYWKFGEKQTEGIPDLAIIYPAIGREFMGESSDKNVWLNRLEPNIVFEDFKALEKIEKSLRLVGLNNFRIYNSEKIPAEIDFMNRFWICLPRNYRGCQNLEHYERTCRFKIKRAKIRERSYFLWKNSNSNNTFFKVKSPLAHYLTIQRSKMGLDGEWHADLDNIFAKDFAIIARFKNNQNDYGLYDYFLAGIRGLGTWGAGWFIDRKYSRFDLLQSDEDIQLLLEIEFRNGRIIDVKDVSEKPEKYFRNEINISTIKKNIKMFYPNR
jgi:hypothetical protein